MKRIAEWKTAKDAAKKGGVDVSGFKDDFQARLKELDTEFAKYLETKKKLLKNWDDVIKTAGSYLKKCDDLEKAVAKDKIKLKLVGDMEAALSELIHELSIYKPK